MEANKREARLKELSEHYGRFFSCNYCRHKGHEVSEEEGYYCFELDMLVKSEQRGCLLYSNNTNFDTEEVKEVVAKVW